jgi:2'-phosphotransferase
MSTNNNGNGRKRRGRGGGKGPDTSKKLSHALSWALRHAAPDIGLTMTPAGWVPVQEIFESKHPRLKGITLQAMEEVVATSDKKRFAFDMRPCSEFSKGTGDEEEKILCIRASQGHSIKTIDPDLLLTKLSAEELMKLSCIVHGTNMEAWNSIAKQGLSKMARTHIHLATGLPQDNGVISGMRRTATVYVYVDPEACIRDGIEFYISDNGVVLTDGIDGSLPVKYFLRVTDSNGQMPDPNENQS